MQTSGDIISSVLDAEGKAVLEAFNHVSASCDDVIETLFHCQGIIAVSGVGKAGIIGKKIAATLASTGTRSMWLDPVNALHGDLGMVSPIDIVLLLSNSGTSVEIIQLAEALGTVGSTRIAMTKSHDTQLASVCEHAIVFGEHKEACCLNLAPTTSTTVMLAIGDALAIALQHKRGFSQREYALNHPAGALGRRLKSVKSCMRTGQRVALVKSTASVAEAMIAVTSAKSGLCVVTKNDSAKLLGVYSDGDFRRDWQAGIDLSKIPVSEVMTTPCKSIKDDSQVGEALELMHKSHINALPVVDRQNTVKGVLDIQDIA